MARRLLAVVLLAVVLVVAWLRRALRAASDRGPTSIFVRPIAALRAQPGRAQAAAHADASPAMVLPECSILFFFHVVKTAGTSMRAVLQRQAQHGDFEYVYTGSTKQPKWHLIMCAPRARARTRSTASPAPSRRTAARRRHQLEHRVALRRLIVEIHAEWGLPRSFFADVRRVRARYEPIGCRVTVGTMLRHPLAWCALYLCDAPRRV